MAKRKSKTEPAAAAPIGTITKCDRCSRQLQVGPGGRPDSQPFRRSRTTKGLCPDCVMTEFLVNAYPINMIIDDHIAEHGGNMVANAEFMRMAFTSSGLMEQCDMDIREVDWQRVCLYWDLPVDERRGPTNPYRMGEAAERKKRQDEQRAAEAELRKTAEDPNASSLERGIARAVLDEMPGPGFFTRGVKQ